MRGDTIKLLLGKCDGMLVRQYQHRALFPQPIMWPMEHSHNDVIKFDSDIVKYVYGKAVGIFLCNLIRAGA